MGAKMGAATIKGVGHGSRPRLPTTSFWWSERVTIKRLKPFKTTFHGCWGKVDIDGRWCGHRRLGLCLRHVSCVLWELRERLLWRLQIRAVMSEPSILRLQHEVPLMAHIRHLLGKDTRGNRRTVGGTPCPVVTRTVCAMVRDTEVAKTVKFLVETGILRSLHR